MDEEIERTDALAAFIGRNNISETDWDRVPWSVTRPLNQMAIEHADMLAALVSIAEHGAEYDGIEDCETMMVRITEKARAAIARATGAA